MPWTLEQRTGVAATLAIVSAIAAFIVACSGNPFIGLLLNLAAIALGGVGLMRSVSPRIGGGLMSIIAIALGAIGLVISVLVMIGVLGAAIF